MQRNTQQREAILHLLEATRRPLSADEILTAARRKIARLGIATVYRNLKAMVEDGKLTVVSLPGEPPRYEIAGKGHHHHFVCDRCDRVFDVPVCASDLRRMTPLGFRLERHEFVFYGQCVDCAE